MCTQPSAMMRLRPTRASSPKRARRSSHQRRLISQMISHTRGSWLWMRPCGHVSSASDMTVWFV